jgi:hypothetical protein
MVFALRDLLCEAQASQEVAEQALQLSVEQ